MPRFDKPDDEISKRFAIPPPDSDIKIHLALPRSRRTLGMCHLPSIMPRYLNLMWSSCPVGAGSFSTFLQG
jgi:hypothetical protein